MLAEKYGLSAFDPDQGYLRQAEELRRRRTTMSLQLGVSEQAAQQYFNDGTFRDIAEGIAQSLAAEHPGTNPFADPDTILIFVDLWLRSIWGLQLAASATRPENETYAWANVEMATSMVAALTQAAGETSQGVFPAPRGGVEYVVRTMMQTAEQIRIWDCAVGELTAENLADALTTDARKLRALVDL